MGHTLLLTLQGEKERKRGQQPDIIEGKCVVLRDTGRVLSNRTLQKIPGGAQVQGDIVSFQLQSDSHLEQQVR